MARMQLNPPVLTLTSSLLDSIRIKKIARKTEW